MSIGPASVTAAARGHLAGRPAVLRASPRHGCCGGTALVPVVEIVDVVDGDVGAGDYDVVEVDGVEVHVDRRLGHDVGGWTIDLDGLLRWRRLVVREASPR